jgi:hypothetical protein
LGGRKKWLGSSGFTLINSPAGEVALGAALQYLCPVDDVSWRYQPNAQYISAQMNTYWPKWFRGSKTMSDEQLWKEIAMGFVGSNLTTFFANDPSSFAVATTIARIKAYGGST